MTGPPAGRVLLVDDADDLRGLVATVLRGGGHEVLQASTVARAREILETQRVDVVMTDLRLGAGSGLDVAAAARSADPEVRIVLLTASRSVDADAVARLRIAQVLHKPATMDQLLGAAARDDRAIHG